MGFQAVYADQLTVSQLSHLVFGANCCPDLLEDYNYCPGERELLVMYVTVVNPQDANHQDTFLLICTSILTPSTKLQTDCEMAQYSIRIPLSYSQQTVPVCSVLVPSEREHWWLSNVHRIIFRYVTNVLFHPS